MRIRNVLKEFEADLHPVQPDSSIQGKSEWKHYREGTYRIKISIRNLPLPDDSKIYLWLDGKLLMQLSVQNHKAKVDIGNDSGIGIPVIKAGQVIQINLVEIFSQKANTKLSRNAPITGNQKRNLQRSRFLIRIIWFFSGLKPTPCHYS
jgi:hypothetical protein